MPLWEAACLCVAVGSLFHSEVGLVNSLPDICYPLCILATQHCHSLALEPPLWAWGGQWAAAATLARQSGSFQNASVFTSSRRQG